MTAGDGLLRVQGLRKLFPVSRNLFLRPTSYVHAVDGVDMEIGERDSLGLVGESGCGKTTVGKMIVGLIPPTQGSVALRMDALWVDVAQLRGAARKRFRRQAQMVFQDPYESMNPRLTIYDTVAEPLVVQGVGSLKEREERVSEMLGLVGITPPGAYLFRYPHELSGGQRQRVAVARALVLGPRLVVADEPTSMLDASVRTGVMRLMQELSERLGISYLYITHDLAVARYMCRRIAVMYLGKIVELAETEELLSNPKHPYTKALLSAVPIPDPKLHRQTPNIKGSVPTPVDPPPRCRFYDRCPIAKEVCASSDHPPLEDKGGVHYAACHLA